LCQPALRHACRRLGVITKVTTLNKGHRGQRGGSLSDIEVRYKRTCFVPLRGVVAFVNKCAAAAGTNLSAGLSASTRRACKRGSGHLPII
jgi:hypothetical protein